MGDNSLQLFLTLPQQIPTSHSFLTELARISLVPNPGFRQSIFRRSVGCPEPLDNIALRARYAVPSRVIAKGVGNSYFNVGIQKTPLQGSPQGRTDLSATDVQASNPATAGNAGIPHGIEAARRMPRGTTAKKAEGPGGIHHASCGSGGWPGPRSFSSQITNNVIRFFFVYLQAGGIHRLFHDRDEPQVGTIFGHNRLQRY
jgi:hypothetical protein